MGGLTGSAYDNNDMWQLAPGTSVDAAVRGIRNVFNFADANVGGTTNPLVLARVPRGAVPRAAMIASDQNLSGINISLGITGTAAKYAAAQAGPAANATVRPNFVIAALDNDPLTDMEEIIATPSGNWPASGTMVTWFDYTKR